jgi:hypothetical protein
MTLMRTGFILFLAAAIAAGCAGPHAGDAEPLERPRSIQGEAGGDDDADRDRCRTNFYGDPHRGTRRADEAREMARLSDGVLLRAERSRGEEREAAVLEAMSQLVAALERDPYGPEPTYKLAVAYALVDRRACSLRLLERVAELQALPEVAAEAGRMIQRAKRDMIFDAFRDEADAALSP